MERTIFARNVKLGKKEKNGVGLRVNNNLPTYKEPMDKKPIRLLRFKDHLKESLKDPVSKAIFDTWGEAIRDEIKPRDKEIDQLLKKIRRLKNGIQLIHDKISYSGYEEKEKNAPLLDDIRADLQKILDRK